MRPVASSLMTTAWSLAGQRSCFTQIPYASLRDQVDLARDRPPVDVPVDPALPWLVLTPSPSD